MRAVPQVDVTGGQIVRLGRLIEGAKVLKVVWILGGGRLPAQVHVEHGIAGGRGDGRRHHHGRVVVVTPDVLVEIANGTGGSRGRGRGRGRVIGLGGGILIDVTVTVTVTVTIVAVQAIVEGIYLSGRRPLCARPTIILTVVVAVVVVVIIIVAAVIIRRLGACNRRLVSGIVLRVVLLVIVIVTVTVNAIVMIVIRMVRRTVCRSRSGGGRRFDLLETVEEQIIEVVSGRVRGSGGCGGGDNWGAGPSIGGWGSRCCGGCGRSSSSGGGRRILFVVIICFGAAWTECGIQKEDIIIHRLLFEMCVYVEVVVLFFVILFIGQTEKRTDKGLGER